MGAYVSMAEIKARYAAANPGGHWFDPSTMAFFRSKLAEGGRTTAGGEVLFASSERPPEMKRQYSIRLLKASGEIVTVGGFCEFGSWFAAERAILKMVEEGESACG